MSAESTIVNLALIHAGVGKKITALTDQTPTARAANELWHPTMKEIQRERIWSFNTRVATLTQVGSVTIAYSTKWARAYRYFAECLRVHAVLAPKDSDGTITDYSTGGRVIEIPFEIISDSTGRLILTNAGPAADVRYAHYEQQVELWPDDYKMTASLRLAAYLAVALGKGDRQKIGERSFMLFQASLNKAAEADAREGVQDNTEASDMENSRNS